MKRLLLPLLLVSCASARGESSALRLVFGEGLCSGTVVGKTTILTAAHCVDGAPLTSVNDVETHAVRIIRDGHDHALVTVDRVIGHGTVRLAEPAVGDAVHWTGNPGGLRHVLRRGYIAAIYPEGALVDAQGYYGDSGSGVFNASGELVGVVSAGNRMSKDGGLAMQVLILYPLAFTRDDWKAIK